MHTRVFISYAFSDTEVMKSLQDELQSYGIATYVAVHDLKPGEHLDKKIEDAIVGSDALVAIITRTSSNSASVNQEIAFAKARKISIVPLIESGAAAGVLLQGLEYIELNTKEITPICKKIVKYLLQRPIEKMEPRKRPSVVLVDQTVVIPSEEYVEQGLPLRKRDSLEIRVTSDIQIDVLIYDKENLLRFKKGRQSYYDKGGRNVVRWNGFFVCPEAGLWTLILDNTSGDKDAKVDVKITKTRATQG